MVVHRINAATQTSEGMKVNSYVQKIFVKFYFVIQNKGTKGGDF